MEKKIAHRVYFDEKYNKPYIRIYRTINGKKRYYEKFTYNLPNKRDYRYIDGLSNAVEMSCSKFKEFRQINNINISECEYFKPTYDDSFYYNSSKKQFFVKVTKKICESFSGEDTVLKYSFSTKDRKLQILIEEIDFNNLAKKYESAIQDRIRKKQARLTRKINRAITRDFGKYDNLFSIYVNDPGKKRKL